MCNLSYLVLVLSIRVGIHQANRDGLDPGVLETGYCLPRLILIEGAVLISACRHATGNLDRVFEAGQRRGLGPDDPTCKATWNERACNL